MSVVYEWPQAAPPKLTTIYHKLKGIVKHKDMTPSDEKVVKDIHPRNFPDATQEHMENTLSAIVEHSSGHHDLTQGIHAHTFHLIGSHWVLDLIPGLEKLSAKYHIGNFVIVRDTGERIFESMPIYARIGMHLLFYGKEQVKLVESKTVEYLLKQQSIKEGKIFDGPDSVKSIPSFIKTYHIDLSELLYPDLKGYKTFNEFFYRKLKPDARPVQNADDPAGFCSVADSRLTVYDTVDLAKEFWIKGNNFSVPELLAVTSEEAKQFDGASLAIFRLAPADYHRFHSPLDGVVGELKHIEGQYYTVNPQAVNESGFDVFTMNTRTVLYMIHTHTGRQVAFVAIGALLVGSIKWTKAKDDTVKRGEELGYFAYGGSTVVVIFPKDMIQFDEDLVKNSKEPIETLMKVGYSIGHGPKK